MINKNDILTLPVTDLTVNGDGVVKEDSYPIFVKGAVIGDVIRLKVTKTNKNYGFGRILEIIKASPDRRTPECPSFSDCGGCSLMHMSYDAQAKFKSDFVLSNLTRIGTYKEDEFIYEGIIKADETLYYRNKSQLPVGKVNGKSVCGFYHAKSHEISPCEKCYIQKDVINKAVSYVMEYIREENIFVYDEKTHKGTVRHIYTRCCDDEIMVCIVTNSEKPLKNTDKLIEKLSRLAKPTLVQNINKKRTNVILGEKDIVLFGNGYIHMSVGDRKFRVSPKSFFQVNSEQMKKLYDKALEYADVKKTDTVFDLYCGVGSISLYMSSLAKKVIGVEIVPDAIENAKENAKLNGIENAEFYTGDAGEVTEKLLGKGERADIAIVDPPRKGCDEKLLSLLKTLSPKKIVYVSCNSSTLARDVKILKDYGYTLKKACAVDLFPNTTHCECVALLEK